MFIFHLCVVDENKLKKMEKITISTRLCDKTLQSNIERSSRTYNMKTSKFPKQSCTCYYHFILKYLYGLHTHTHTHSALKYIAIIFIFIFCY